MASPVEHLVQDPCVLKPHHRALKQILWEKVLLGVLSQYRKNVALTSRGLSLGRMKLDGTDTISSLLK